MKITEETCLLVNRRSWWERFFEREFRRVRHLHDYDNKVYAVFLYNRIVRMFNVRKAAGNLDAAAEYPRWTELLTGDQWLVRASLVDAPTKGGKYDQA
ncbi:MAG: hypothetical protein WCV67_02920 [Victivallaceae bacterium]|jgi:hypothetical protein